MEKTVAIPESGSIQSGQRHTLAGFTLFDLMVAMAIVGILAAVAVPSFMNQMREGRRSDAKSALLDLASREERYFATYNVYTSSASGLYGSSTASFPLAISAGGTGDYNVIAPVVASGTASAAASYTLEADPVGDQLKDLCGGYTLTSLGVQSNVNPPSTLPTNCW